MCSTPNMKSWVLSMPPSATLTTHITRAGLSGRMAAMCTEASGKESLMGRYTPAGWHRCTSRPGLKRIFLQTWNFLCGAVASISRYPCFKLFTSLGELFLHPTAVSKRFIGFKVNVIQVVMEVSSYLSVCTNSLYCKELSVV